MLNRNLFFIGILLIAHSFLIADEPMLFDLGNDGWTLINKNGLGQWTIDKPELITVTSEKYDKLPLFNVKGAEYNRGMKLHRTRAQECPTSYAVILDSIIIREKPEKNSFQYERDKDYQIEPKWGCIGRLPESRISEQQSVYIDYVYGKMRIDSLVRTPTGQLIVKKGVSHVTTPVPPELDDGETRLANIWIKASIEKLTPAQIFPILESQYPELPARTPTTAERLLPKTIAKLKAGETVNILAWGDSVTDAGYLPNPQTERWQEQFVARLRAKFPKANIVLKTEAWGGRNTDSYRNEPSGSPKNYKEKVLDQKPDLIVSEFVNDSYLRGDVLEQRYSKILLEFKEIGAEWVILTPHYVRSDWMGLQSEQGIDDDPRPYTKSLREFTAKNNIALADAAKRYGRLWRQGIPYSTLLMNNINHPNPFGMKLFADALMELFETGQ
ncbi:MAG: GDSL-type esterase/lipase family protein [Planctomycetaceae bacterium]|jgi:lysophospholipase L1-like esterase|nr:GDSL-type esterase/lipase family protein [Planctomycetaceae bacterium]